jgi:hypothetical protein
VPEWEAKNEFGLHIWESADAADQIRGRLRELSAHQPERFLSPANFVLAHKDDPAAQLAPYFERLYPVVEQMIRDIPDDGLNVHWTPVVADEAVLKEL